MGTDWIQQSGCARELYVLRSKSRQTDRQTDTKSIPVVDGGNTRRSFLLRFFIRIEKKDALGSPPSYTFLKNYNKNVFFFPFCLIFRGMYYGQKTKDVVVVVVVVVVVTKGNVQKARMGNTELLLAQYVFN